MLDKSIKYKKEYRKPYYDSRRFDFSCRNHGNCLWCKENRLYQFTKEILRVDSQLQDYLGDNYT